MSVNLDELRNLARGANNPPPLKKKNNWGWFFLIIIGIICYQIFNSSEKDSELIEANSTMTQEDDLSYMNTDTESQTDLEQYITQSIDSANNNDEVNYQQTDEISEEIIRDDAVLGSQVSEESPKTLSQNCYYVGAIKLRAREELTADPNVNVKILDLGDEVCLHQKAPSPFANSQSIWYLVSKNDEYQGWVDGSYLLQDPVDLTDNLPKDWNEKTAELKSRIREYNLNN